MARGTELDREVMTTHNVEGLNAAQNRALYDAYPNLNDAAAASDEELDAIEGIGPAAIANIRAWSEEKAGKAPSPAPSDLPIEVPATDEQQAESVPQTIEPDLPRPDTQASAGPVEQAEYDGKDDSSAGVGDAGKMGLARGDDDKETNGPKEDREDTTPAATADAAPTPSDAPVKSSSEPPILGDSAPSSEAPQEERGATGSPSGSTLAGTDRRGGPAVATGDIAPSAAVTPRVGNDDQALAAAESDAARSQELQDRNDEEERRGVESEQQNADEVEEIEEAAELAHEAIRQTAERQGDVSAVGWDAATEEQKEDMRARARSLLIDPATTPAALHGSWVAQRSARGWSFGPSLNEGLKQDPRLVPFDKLGQNEQERERVASDAIRSVLDLDALPADSEPEGDKRYRLSIAGKSSPEVDALRDAVAANGWPFVDAENGRAIHITVPAGGKPFDGMEEIAMVSGR